MNSQNISCFLTLYTYTFNHDPPHSIGCLSLFLTCLSTSYSLINRDIFNNFPYFIWKSNITMTYQYKKYVTQKKQNIPIRNLKHFLTIFTLYQISLNQSSIFSWYIFLYQISMREQLTLSSNKIPFIIFLCAIFF